MLASFFSIATLVSICGALPTLTPRASICNGRAELCERSYGNTTFLMSHDSYAISSINPARTQEIDLTAQMNLGVRSLQAQSHMKDGELHWCHTSCLLLDGGPVLSYLQTVKSFMDSHPDEVFTFLFTNPEGVSLKNVWDPLFQQTGLAALAYVPPKLPMKASEWPTLGSMIDSGKRLVVFMDYGSNTADVPYILPEFDHIWEPPFDSTDPHFPCKVDRISGPLSSEDHMFMINHNLNVNLLPLRPRVHGEPDNLTGAVPGAVDHAGHVVSKAVNQGQGDSLSLLVPDYFDAPVTNGVPSILADSNGCAPFSGGKATSFVMLDFVDIGKGMNAVDLLNGFTE